MAEICNNKTNNKIFKLKYSEVILTFQQTTQAKLPYYGPVMRGWLGCNLFKDEYLWYNIFKNPYLDVRPYYMWTRHKGNQIHMHLTMAGLGEKFIRDILDTVITGQRTHVAGIVAIIRSIKYERKTLAFSKKDVNNIDEITIMFVSPTHIHHNYMDDYLPDLNTILGFLVRSANRYTKYYLPRKYPLITHYPEIHTEIEKASIKPVVIRHKNIKGAPIELRGIKGYIKYQVKTTHRDLKNILRVLSLAKMFQIGKKVSYGFGKLEVLT